jgi:TolB-like protein/DNA-binding winged helix-turn-helix (wHTH) protein/Tfp pilus assembly protein PilF
MPGESHLTHRICFGEVTLDRASAELELNGTRQRLPDQAFQVLELLTARPGQLVTREDLIARLWPKATYIDTDAGLNTAVRKLRAALGDDADHPRYVETVPRRGYRFIADVEPARSTAAGDTPPPERTPLPAAGPAPPQLVRRVPVLIWLLIAAVGAALVAWLARGPLLTRAPADSVAAASVLPSRNVAVLPFLNLTGNSRQDYLALGLAENVLHQLAQLREVNVIAHTSSFRFGGRSEDIREIGRKLNSRYLLEGSVQGSSARLRVTTQLIDATTGSHLWSKSFDRAPEDLFAVEDEIATEVAKALQLSVNFAAEPLRHSGTQNPDAWLAFQQGRMLVSTRKYENLVAAVASLEQAVQLDPHFADAYVELANACLLQARYRPFMGAEAARRLVRQATEQAVSALNRALGIDPKLGDALIIRGAVAMFLDDTTKAEADLLDGLALSPNSARGHQLLGELLAGYPARTEEALARIERARLLDPLEPRGPYYQGLVESLRGNVAEAERLLLASLQLRPDYAPALTRLATLSWRWRGQFADAVKYSEYALRAEPQGLFVRVPAITLYLEMGDIAAAQSLAPSGASVGIQTVALPLYGGDYGNAAALLYTDPEYFTACDWSSDSYALLEQARASGQYLRARRFLEQHASIVTQGNAPLVKPGAEHAATVVAQLLESSGDHERARRLLEEVLKQLDRATLPTSGNCVHVTRTRARTLALLQRDAEAMVDLKRATLGENAWYHGWYVFERDPAYAHLRDDPEFRSLRASYRARVNLEHIKLAQLRSTGLIPARP